MFVCPSAKISYFEIIYRVNDNGGTVMILKNRHLYIIMCYQIIHNRVKSIHRMSDNDGTEMINWMDGYMCVCPSAKILYLFMCK